MKTENEDDITGCQKVHLVSGNASCLEIWGAKKRTHPLPVWLNKTFHDHRLSSVVQNHLQKRPSILVFTRGERPLFLPSFLLSLNSLPFKRFRGKPRNSSHRTFYFLLAIECLSPLSSTLPLPSPSTSPLPKPSRSRFQPLSLPPPPPPPPPLPPPPLPLLPFPPPSPSPPRPQK